MQPHISPTADLDTISVVVKADAKASTFTADLDFLGKIVYIDKLSPNIHDFQNFHKWKQIWRTQPGGLPHKTLTFESIHDLHINMFDTEMCQRFNKNCLWSSFKTPKDTLLNIRQFRTRQRIFTGLQDEYDYVRSLYDMASWTRSLEIPPPIHMLCICWAFYLTELNLKFNKDHPDEPYFIEVYCYRDDLTSIKKSLLVNLELAFISILLKTHHPDAIMKFHMILPECTSKNPEIQHYFNHFAANMKFSFSYPHMQGEDNWSVLRATTFYPTWKDSTRLDIVDNRELLKSLAK